VWVHFLFRYYINTMQNILAW